MHDNVTVVCLFFQMKTGYLPVTEETLMEEGKEFEKVSKLAESVSISIYSIF